MPTPREELNRLRALARQQPAQEAVGPRDELERLRALSQQPEVVEPEIVPPEPVDRRTLAFKPTGEALTPEMRREVDFIAPVTEAARKTGEFLGLEKAVDPFARVAARAVTRLEGVAPEVVEKAIPEPTAGELVGGGLQIASLVLPYGKMLKGAESIAAKAIAPTAAKIFGSATAGAIGGYTYEAGEKIQKGEKPIPGLMTVTGAIIPGGIGTIGVGGKIIREKVPARMINSLVKPLLKDFSYGKNPGRIIAEEKIVANSFDDLVSKISAKRTEIGGHLGNVSDVLDDKMAKKGLVVNLKQTTNHIDLAMKKAAQQNNQPLINRLSEVKKAITQKLSLGKDEAGRPIVESLGERELSSLSFRDALDIKQAIGDMTKFTGNISDDEIANKALKKVWGSMKGELNKKAAQIDPSAASRFSKLNEKYADITSADVAAKYRDKIMERHNIITLKGHFGAIGGALMALMSTGGAAAPALLAGATGAVLDKALGSTAVKTRIASWLAKATLAEKLAIQKNAPNVAKAFAKHFKARFPGDIIIGGRGK